MPDFISTDVNQGVAVLTLNRPERLNAMGNEMGRQFDEAMVDIALNDDVRVVILTGAGRGFCAGADMERLSGFAQSKGESAKFPAVGEARGAFRALEGKAPGELLTRYNSPQALRQPVIAAVNGACAGIGLAIAAMCDIRFGSTDCFFLAPFAKRGLIAETGLASSLSALIGFGRAGEMLLSGRRVLADEAHRIGLLEHLCDPHQLMPRVMAYAQDMASSVSPRSTRTIKRQLWRARNQTFFEAASDALDETRQSMKSEDFQEGLAHFREKRPPRFTGR